MGLSVASLRSDLQHAIGFLPVQLILNVGSGLRLDHEANQTEQEESRCNQVFLAGCFGSVAFRTFTPNCRPPGLMQHRAAFGVGIPHARVGVGPAMAVIFEKGLLRAAVCWSV